MSRSGPAPGGLPAAVLTIDAGAIAANWRLLAGRAAPGRCAAAVKADAYGIGVDAAVPALVGAGCDTFFVAHLDEGSRVRALAPDATVYVLNGLRPGSAGDYAAARLRPVLGSLDEIEEWTSFAQGESSAPPAALHVDTGMNRLGLPPQALPEALRRMTPALLMSHFVSAEIADDAINARQIAAFAAARALAPGVPGSLANSSGLFLGAGALHDLSRPGYALYGGNPTPGRPNPMRPVVTLEATIVQVREVEAGATVGYNARWTARGPRRLATISVGYADCYPRSAFGADDKPGGLALVAGVSCPIAGRVSMDLIVIDVTEAPAAASRRGDVVTLIGDGLEIDDVGERAGTVGYEILTNLGSRYTRRIVR